VQRLLLVRMACRARRHNLSAGVRLVTSLALPMPEG
jgi:hypothetical protein